MALDPAIEAKIHDTFARQAAMATIGATIVRLDTGLAELALPFSAHITQQHGFVHAGMLATALDTACGICAVTVMPLDSGILTIEYKINLLAPGKGERFRLIGRVRKAGRTIVVTEGEAIAVGGGKEKLIATMSATEMVILGRDDVKG
jgi:uncharacterized protein (TIGR00369 family)